MKERGEQEKINEERNMILRNSGLKLNATVCDLKCK